MKPPIAAASANGCDSRRVASAAAVSVTIRWATNAGVVPISPYT